jgi:peroxidase
VLSLLVCPARTGTATRARFSLIFVGQRKDKTMNVIDRLVRSLNRKPRLRRVPPTRLILERLEERVVPSATGTRPITEVGNNIASPTLGTAGTDLLRVSPVAYADGISSPSLPNNPSARVISDILNNQANPANPPADIATIDQNSLSDFGYSWGQFIDHDMDLTPTDPTQILQILADPNDPSQMGNQTFTRSVIDPLTGPGTGKPAQQVNAVTSFLDLSQVYGSSQNIADALRTFSGGLLKTSPGNMLPYDNLTYFTQDQLNIINMANDSGAVPTASLFVTGDVRGNENVELTALQTLFVRNHNLIAGQLQKEHPTWNDEQLYQEARKLNIAEYQMITYKYYLPDLLGPNAIKGYTGYKANVDPSIATEFSTIAFRFGHSLLSGEIERHDNNGQDLLPNDPAGANVSLAQDFFDPNVLNPFGVTDPLTGHTSSDIDAILKGQADGNAQADDLMAINDVRNLLFANGGLQDNGQDLMARDVERARDDGIGTYNQVRVAYGLPAVTSFAQITKNVQVQHDLQQAYGTVDNIDPFEGGLAEDHAPGSDMGPLFTRILANQFTRLRDGDRFFYGNETFNKDELNILQHGNTLTKVMENNTHLTNLQGDAFLFKASISGTVFYDANGNGQKDRRDFGLPGITVQLLNDAGDVIATTRTDHFGNYTFTQLSGPSGNVEVGPGVSATGTYHIALVLPSALKPTTSTEDVQITNGDTHVRGVNAGVQFASGVSFSGLDPMTAAALASGLGTHR